MTNTILECMQFFNRNWELGTRNGDPFSSLGFLFCEYGVGIDIKYE